MGRSFFGIKGPSKTALNAKPQPFQKCLKHVPDTKQPQPFCNSCRICSCGDVVVTCPKCEKVKRTDERSLNSITLILFRQI